MKPPSIEAPQTKPASNVAQQTTPLMKPPSIGSSEPQASRRFKIRNLVAGAAVTGVLPKLGAPKGVGGVDVACLDLSGVERKELKLNGVVKHSSLQKASVSKMESNEKYELEIETLDLTNCGVNAVVDATSRSVAPSIKSSFVQANQRPPVQVATMDLSKGFGGKSAVPEIVTMDLSEGYELKNRVNEDEKCDLDLSLRMANMSIDEKRQEKIDFAAKIEERKAKRLVKYS